MNTSNRFGRSLAVLPRRAAWLQVAFIIAAAIAMFGCGGGGGSSSSGTSNPPPSPPPSVSVSVSPSSASVLLGNTQQFNATVTGSSNTAVTWSVNNVVGGNSSVGTITSAGLYTAPSDLPSPASVTVTAASQAGGSATANAAVTVTSDIQVAVQVSAPYVQTSGTLGLTATITSSGHPNQSLTWSVDGVAGGNSTEGTIISTGTGTATYTAPAALPTPYTVAIQVTSVADLTKNATASVAVAGTIASATQSVSAALGGTLTLPDGSSVTIPPGALAADQEVSLSEVSVLPEQPPNVAIRGVGPGLVLAFSSPNLHSTVTRRRSSLPSIAELPSGSYHHATAQTQNATGTAMLQFSINASQNAVSGLQGSAPMADLHDLFGNNNFTGIGGTYDGTSHVAQLTVPASLLAEVSAVSVSMANWGTDPLAGDCAVPPPQYGPRLWNGSCWAPFSCPTGKALVLVHGMASSCEGAFSNSGQPCVEAIKSAGGYDGVVGFNYDWTQDINQSGSQLASFLNTLAQCPNVAQTDIEAHSEGVPVSMSAATQANAQSQSKITNFISLGGPIMGTPVATSADLILTALMNLPGGELVPPVSLVQTGSAPYLTGLVPNSPEMAAIRQNFAKDLPSTRVVMAGGTQPNLGPLVNEILGSLFPGIPFDDIIGMDSAMPSNAASGLGNVVQLPPYPVGHTQLECNPSTVHDVGQGVQGLSVAAQSLAASPATLAFGATQGGSNPAAQLLTIIDRAGTSLVWQASASSDAGWLTISPLSGTTTGVASVSANIAGLSPGGYSGSITLTSPGVASLTVPAALTVISSVGAFDLSVSFQGLGNGNVYVANLSGGYALGTGSCGTDCFIYPAGTRLELGENPSLGSVFGGWGGACSGMGTCMVTMSQNESVTATFNLSGGTQYTLSVGTAGTGSGTVGVSPTGTSCGAGCYSYSSGTVVQLTATPASGSTFAGWSGACSGTGGCTVTMNQNQSVTASFNLSGGGTQYTLTVATAGTGGGTVGVSPTGTSCGAGCYSYASGTAVQLTATPASGSTFAGWSGACSGTGGCMVTMNQNQSVTATFNTSSGQQIGVNGANVTYISGNASCGLSSGGVFDNCSGSVTLDIQTPITSGTIYVAVGNAAGTNFINCGTSVPAGSTPGTVTMSCAGSIPQGTCPPGDYMLVGDDNTLTIGSGTVNFAWSCGPGSVSPRRSTGLGSAAQPIKPARLPSPQARPTARNRLSSTGPSRVSRP